MQFRYKQFSLLFYTVLMESADDLEAVSVDEALIEVTSSVIRLRNKALSSSSTSDPAKALAETIRTRVREATGCEGSHYTSYSI